MKKLRKEDFFTRINETFPPTSLKSWREALQHVSGAACAEQSGWGSVLPGKGDHFVTIVPAVERSTHEGASPTPSKTAVLLKTVFYLS